MGRRGQVATYALVGILIVFVVVSVWVARPTLRGTVRSVSFERQVDALRAYVQSCVDEVAATGVFVVGSQGGYARAPVDAVDTGRVRVAVWARDGEVVAPSVEQIGSELGEYVKEMVALCVDMSRFPFVKGAGVEAGAWAGVNQESVAVKAWYPLVAESGGARVVVKDVFASTVPVRLGKVVEAGMTVVESEVASQVVDANRLLETGMDVAIIPSDGARVYAITDRESVVHGVPYTFMLASQG